MTIEDLKKRATASELTLIAEVEKLVPLQAKAEARREVMDALNEASKQVGKPDYGTNVGVWFQSVLTIADRILEGKQ